MGAQCCTPAHHAQQSIPDYHSSAVQSASIGDVAWMLARYTDVFFVYSYVAYLDDGGALFIQVSRPQFARRQQVADSSLPSAQTSPKNIECAQRNHEGKESEQKEKQRKSYPPLTFICGCHERGRG